ncbi:acyl-CoA dehydrogenase, partial [Streptomyces pristinaespiralis ATCC 25486]
RTRSRATATTRSATVPPGTAASNSWTGPAHGSYGPSRTGSPSRPTGRTALRRHRPRRHRVRRLAHRGVRPHPPAPLHRPPGPGRTRIAARAHARDRRPARGRRGGGRPGHPGTAAGLAGGHEDGAQDRLARLRHAHRSPRRPRPPGRGRRPARRCHGDRRGRRRRTGRRRRHGKRHGNRPRSRPRPGGHRVMNAIETQEHKDLREAVAALGRRHGPGFDRATLWEEAGKLGYLGVNLPEEYGGGGGGISELSIVLEESGAAGCPLLMMIVSPAICATVIARFGTDEQKRQWLPGLADGSLTMAFGITEPDAGSNSHRITTTARRDGWGSPRTKSGGGWILTGRKVFVSGVDIADATLIVGRTEDARTGSLKPCLFIVPRDAEGFGRSVIDMELQAQEKQFELVLDDVRLPADALVGNEDAGLLQLFAGLNPERIMTAAFAIGMGRYALAQAVEYAKTRQVWKAPIGAHQAIAHPLAQAHIELELAKLMMQKAAALYDAGDDVGAGEAANMAKYAAGEACVKAVDQAVHTLGGNGLTREYGLAKLIAAARVARIAPVSREMILNYVSHQSLGLPKSY